MESCSRNDEGWVYCRDNKPISVDQALEKRILVLKRIIRALRKNAELREACGGKRYTGLDESIYYDQCGSLMSADEIFEKNSWVRGTEDLFVNSYHGLNRLDDTYTEYAPFNIIVRSVREKMLSVNPLIMKENAEAIYLLMEALNPNEFLSEAAEIILSSILDDISGQRKELLVAMLVGKGLIKKHRGFETFTGMVEERTEIAFIDFGIKFVPELIKNSMIRSIIVATIVHNMVNIISIKNSFFLRKGKGIIKGANAVVFLLSNYGIVEKLSKSARRLKINYPWVYHKLDEVRLTLSYHFFEDIFDEILRLSEVTSSNSTDRAFVKSIENLLDNYAT
ncbi:hypothetical protein [Xenorhabdus sp. PB62.4]|uniref:hypothetical protein n=1 Tax=Xenorhabdus sp. PB62.4 TaxID=1851573 RepID=UPI0016574210|nr:hypothetical protein [Xenorhabdus sp. PB62.4]MBC8953467.1 hypothetical protein [Xenorhabdus sp. PB62.4]